MKAILSILAAGILLIACEKDKFQTKPQIEVRSANPDVVGIGGDLNIRLQFTDKEGDVDDSLVVIRQRLNERDFSAQPYSLRYKIPVFPDKSKGEMDVLLSWARALTLQSSPLKIPGLEANEPDTLQLRFAVRDKAGNTSDTVTLDKNIIVIR